MEIMEVFKDKAIQLLEKKEKENTSAYKLFDFPIQCSTSGIALFNKKL